MSIEYILRDFVIGSSFLVVLPFYLVVKNLVNKNYRYDDYTLIAPVYLGLMNVLSGVLQRTYNLSDRERYLLISLISPLFVFIFAYCRKTYNYTPKQWRSYAVRITINHFLVYNIIMYYLNKNV
jgi:hypothetical protein